MPSSYYSDQISLFLKKSSAEIIGEIALSDEFASLQTQKKSWASQILILKKALEDLEGEIHFEFNIPRMGKRVDTIVIIKDIVIVIEFKVGERIFHSRDIEQVWDYSLDLKNFHRPSHSATLIPILVATEAKTAHLNIVQSTHNDNVIQPLLTNGDDLRKAISTVLSYFEFGNAAISNFISGSYSPTPTIIEAAISLYRNHSVEAITRNDAAAKNLTLTTKSISTIIDDARTNHKKVICFVTGVPGAGKTLVGLKTATSQLKKDVDSASVYLSGNGPLVAILQEALARDKVKSELALNKRVTKKDAKRSVKLFIQIIHHYRDEYLKDLKAPNDHVAIFDEAQRAWNSEQTIKFMKQRKGMDKFNSSEPEFLISCLDRHPDWAVVVCLVGGGQEINTGEAGISEWLNAINRSFPEWEVHISPNLKDSEYAAEEAIEKIQGAHNVVFNPDLHLAVSMRSFRAEKLSSFVKQLLDLDIEAARDTLSKISSKYPIVITRELSEAKKWLQSQARGSERYGIIVSSQAQRLKPLAIDVRSPIDPVHWFLDDKEDVRSSFYLEDVATEFQVQGLELDWACVTWDGDLRYSDENWETYSFRGSKWQRIKQTERKKYL